MRSSRITVKAEAVRFVAVGLLNVVLTFVVYGFLLTVVNIPYLPALCITWVVAIVFSYTLNFIWVFTPEARLAFNARFLKYGFSYLTSFVVNVVLLHYAVVDFDVDPLLAQALLFPMLAVFNFVSAKCWSLKHGAE